MGIWDQALSIPDPPHGTVPASGQGNSEDRERESDENTSAHDSVTWWVLYAGAVCCLRASGGGWRSWEWQCGASLRGNSYGMTPGLV